MTRRLPYIILTTLLPLMARADPKPSVQTSTAQAKAALTRLNTQLQSAQSMNFDCTATLPNGQTTAQIKFMVKGFAQRPNKFSIEVKRDGKLAAVIISDGQIEYAYNPATQRYAQFPAIGSFQDMAKALAGGLAQYKSFAVFNADALPMGFVTEPVAVFFHAQMDIGAAGFGDLAHYSYSASPATINNTPVINVVQRFDDHFKGDMGIRSGGDLRLVLRQDSGLPLRLVKDMSVAGRVVLMGRYDFRSFQVSKSPLSASAFTWTPPPGAQLYQPTP